MKVNQPPAKTESLMASTLLAISSILYRTNKRTNQMSPARFAHAERTHVPRKIVPSPLQWYHRLAQPVKRRITDYFHCAIPNGLSAADFDLSDLTPPSQKER